MTSSFDITAKELKSWIVDLADLQQTDNCITLF